MMERIVIDTSVFVSAILNADGAPRDVLRLVLDDQVKPLMGEALFKEFEDVLSRQELFQTAPVDKDARNSLFDAFLLTCDWVSIWYLWRPNLRDEADNHVLELALAGNASFVVTKNLKDFRNAQLLFPSVQIHSPGDYLKFRRQS